MWLLLPTLALAGTLAFKVEDADGKPQLVSNRSLTFGPDASVIQRTGVYDVTAPDGTVVYAAWEQGCRRGAVSVTASKRRIHTVIPTAPVLDSTVELTIIGTRGQPIREASVDWITKPNCAPHLWEPGKAIPIGGPWVIAEVHAEGMRQSRSLVLERGTNRWVMDLREPEHLVDERDGQLHLSTPIRFDIDKARLRPHSIRILEAVAAWLNDNDEAKLRVEGHREPVPHASPRARDLTDQRSESVVEFLISRGIERARLEHVGFGESMWGAPGRSMVPRMNNPWVELYVVR